MKIYFSSNPKTLSLDRKRILNMIGALKDAGVMVYDNVSDKVVTDVEMERAFESGQLLLTQVDGLILEGTYPTSEIGHLIALAITIRKPTLYLLERGKTLDKTLVVLLKNKDVQKLLHVVYYTKQDTEACLLEFISHLEVDEKHELPNIKFTLRVTQRMERFLHWKSQRAKLSKANFLREIIRRMMGEDEEYQKYQKNVGETKTQ